MPKGLQYISVATLFQFVGRFARVRVEDSSRNRFALNGIQRDFFGGVFSRGILSGYRLVHIQWTIEAAWHIYLYIYIICICLNIQSSFSLLIYFIHISMTSIKSCLYFTEYLFNTLDPWFSKIMTHFSRYKVFKKDDKFFSV